jgi:outer membrane immunogenic protein
VTTSHFLDRAFVPGIGLGGTALPTNITSIGSHDAIVPGWIAGGGFEYAFTNNLSVKAEGMYYELQKSHAGGFEVTNFNTGFNTNIFTGNSNIVTTEVKHHGFLVRGGINWRFYGMQ